MSKAEIQKQQDQYVAKDNDLIQKARFDFTLEEQKLVCYAISKLKPTEKDFQQEYTLSALEFAEVAGIDKKNVYSVFRKAIDSLDDKRKWITIDGEVHKIGIFTEPHYNPKQGSISFKFDSRLKKYLLELSGNYTQYELWNILSLKSKYSIRIYELFKSHEYKHKIEIEVDYLKSLLCAEKYKSFGNLKQKVLDVGITEINEYTDLDVRYETSKKGRGGRVDKLIFSIKTKNGMDRLNAYRNTRDRINKKNKQYKGQISLFDYAMFEEIQKEDRQLEIVNNMTQNEK